MVEKYHQGKATRKRVCFLDHRNKESELGQTGYYRLKHPSPAKPPPLF